MQSIHGNYCRKQNHSLSHEARHAIPVYLCEYDVNQTATLQNRHMFLIPNANMAPQP